MSNKELFKKVKDLYLPIGKYALFGSAPLGVRNLKECHDVDIIVSEDLFKEYGNKSEWERGVASSGAERLFSGDIELFRDWRPGEWDVNKIIDEAEIIDGLPFVKLEEMIKWKKIMGRDKDFKDIEIAEKYIRNKVNLKKTRLHE